jgi:hypothetical protein
VHKDLTPNALNSLGLDLPNNMMEEIAGERMEMIHVLGEGVLEALACKALVAAHLQSADHPFVLRAVQVLLQHSSLQDQPVKRHKALSCLRYMRNQGINLNRCMRLGIECCYRGIQTSTAPSQYFVLPMNLEEVKGVEGSYYQPQPFR